MADYDLIAIGNGVAGLTTAISGALLGLKCAIVSPAWTSLRKPGEIVDANAWYLFQRMGVADALAAANPILLSGYAIKRSGESAPVGSTRTDERQSIVIPRAELEAILQSRAFSLGVHFLRCDSVSVAYMRKGRVPVLLDETQTNARFVVDATGKHRLLAKTYSLMVERHSPPLLAFYSYRKRTRGERLEAVFEWETSGWTWTAPFNREETAMVRLSWGHEKKDILNAIRRDPRWGGAQIKAADVSWTVVSKPAGSGYFLVGDAACVLDPASGSGILRALQSGFITGDLVCAVLKEKLIPFHAEQIFQAQIRRSFMRDKFFLSSFYGNWCSETSRLETSAAKPGRSRLSREQRRSGVSNHKSASSQGLPDAADTNQNTNQNFS